VECAPEKEVPTYITCQSSSSPHPFLVLVWT
jgi:hypothetical protein